MLGTHLAHCNARPERYRLAWEMPAQIDVPVGSVPEGWGHARLIPTFGIRKPAGAVEARDLVLAGRDAWRSRVWSRALEGAGRSESAGDRDFRRGPFQGRERQDGDP